MRAAPLLALALLLAGCLTPGPMPAPGTDVATRTLDQGPSSGIGEPTRTVFSNATAWVDFWARHASNRDPPPELPAVDFATERVVAVVLGSRSSGCWSVEVSNVTREDGGIVANVTTTDSSGPGHLCTATFTRPYHFVAIGDATAPVRFEERLLRPNGNASREAEPLSARPLHRGHSGIVEDTRALVRDAAAWEALWAKHRPNETAPRVEFPNESVVAVVITEPTPCSSVRVGNVTYDAAARVITVEVVRIGGPTELCASSMAHANAFVAIPSREGDARFVEREKAWGEPLHPRELASGFQSGIEGGTRALIRDEAAWRDAWARHASIQEPAPEPPKVDFANESVVAVALTDKPNGCWAVRIGNVLHEEDTILVEVVTQKPPPGAMCASVVSRPFAFVAIPAREGDAAFVDAA